MKRTDIFWLCILSTVYTYYPPTSRRGLPPRTNQFQRWIQVFIEYIVQQETFPQSEFAIRGFTYSRSDDIWLNQKKKGKWDSWFDLWWSEREQVNCLRSCSKCRWPSIHLMRKPHQHGMFSTSFIISIVRRHVTDKHKCYIFGVSSFLEPDLTPAIETLLRRETNLKKIKTQWICPTSSNAACSKI